MASPSKNFKMSITGIVDEDLLSKLPEHVTDIILQRLPVWEAARLSVLSKKWRNNLSSIKSLYFNQEFQSFLTGKFGKLDWQRFSNIITNTLLLHHGPIHNFLLFIPSITGEEEITLFLFPSLCFLSRSGVKNIVIVKHFGHSVPLPSHIFMCKELQSLCLENLTLKPPPSEFDGFLHLRVLMLTSIRLEKERVRSLITSCPELSELKIEKCRGLDGGLVIDSPRLERLSLDGVFGLITLKNSPKLAHFLYNNEVRFLRKLTREFIDFKNLAYSCKLQSLVLGLRSLKCLAKHGLRKSLQTPLAFTHLHDLALRNLDLDDLDVSYCTLGLLQSCPFIKKLNISINASKNVNIQHNLVYDTSYKFGDLLEVKFKGITGSSVELNLIEYVLQISTVLEKLFIVFGKLDAGSELRVQRELNGFQRASPKARIVFL